MLCRILTYFDLSCNSTIRINAGNSYGVFKRCVSISLLDFTLFSNTDEFFSCFHLREDNRHTIYTDKMEFHVLEVQKSPKVLKEDSSDLLLYNVPYKVDTTSKKDCKIPLPDFRM